MTVTRSSSGQRYFRETKAKDKNKDPGKYQCASYVVKHDSMHNYRTLEVHLTSKLDFVLSL